MRKKEEQISITKIDKFESASCILQVQGHAILIKSSIWLTFICPILVTEDGYTFLNIPVKFQAQYLFSL